MGGWPAPLADERVSRRWRQILASALACVIIGALGCDRADEGSEVEFVYDMADYDMAERAVIGQVRNRLDREQIELRGLWLGLRPVEDGPSMLNADVDAYCDAGQAEEVSRVVAETALSALPKHDRIRVRVFWWREMPGDDWAHPAGTWTWNAEGNMVEHIAAEEPH